MTGYYSIIQYLHDESRAERVNVGLMLIAAPLASPMVRIASDNDRPRKLFALDHDEIALLRSQKGQLARRINCEGLKLCSYEGLDHFQAELGGPFRLTEPQFVDVEELESTFKELYEDFVGEPRTRAQSHEATKKLSRSLRDFFGRPDFKDKVRTDYSVDIPGMEKQLQVPYALKNGVLTLVRPQGLAVDAGRVRNEALRFAAEAKLITETKIGGLQVCIEVVMPSVSGPDASLLDELRYLYRKNPVAVIEERDIPKLEEKVLASSWA